jgi:hypothetical protein
MAIRVDTLVTSASFATVISLDLSSCTSETALPVALPATRANPGSSLGPVTRTTAT